MYNMEDIDSNSWYQSVRRSPRTYAQRSRLFQKQRFKPRKFNKNFWNQWKREVLEGLNHMSLCDLKKTHRIIPNITRDARRMRRSKCYICHVRGHGYGNCPFFDRKKEIDKGKQIVSDGPSNLCVPTVTWLVQGTDGKSWNTMWYVTDEYPRHMTSNLETFDRFKQDTACSSELSRAGLDVRGIGEIIVNTISHNFVIPGALYVTNIGLNILSLNQLTQQGFVVVFKDGKCSIYGMFDTTSSGKTSDTDSSEGSDTSSDKTKENDGDTLMKDRYGLDESEKGSERSGKEGTDTHVDKQQMLDVDKERVIRAIMKYYDSLYFKDSIIQEEDESEQTPSNNDFESLIGFLEMVNEQEIIPKCKGLVQEHFEKLVKWFYKVFMRCEERPATPKINGHDVSLLDLYLIVKRFGGHERVSIKNCWSKVAKAMDLQEDFADCLKDLYATHLSLLAAYYDVAKDYSSGYLVPKAKDCGGTSGVAEVEKPEEETEREVESNKEDEEYVDEIGTEGKIEYDDGETLIISFEVDKDGREVKQLVEETNNEEMEDDGNENAKDSDGEGYVIVIE